MAVLPQYFARARLERVIGILRVVLAATLLLAVWLDPPAPAAQPASLLTLHLWYLGFAALLLVVMWRHDGGGRLPLVVQTADLAVAWLLQYFTLGPASPFFIYFVFALFSAALRWGWRGTVRTAVPVLVSFVLMGLSLSRTMAQADFELDRFVIRIAYLVVVTVVLVYLGQHEEHLREEMRQLARWPSPDPDGAKVAEVTILGHAAAIVGAASAAIVWSTDDEPWVYLSSWPAGSSAPAKLPPAELEPLVPDALADSTFFSFADVGRDAVASVHRSGTRATWRGRPVHEGLIGRLSGPGIASVPFRTDQLSGRVFFAGVTALGSDLMPLVEVVGREIGAALDQIASHERARQLAITEDRIRVARDLHDGVLQSLTGIRLELQSMAMGHLHPMGLPAGEQLSSLERALAIEQRELRRFIEELKPSPRSSFGGSLVERLEDLRRRLALEWRTPITVRIGPMDAAVSPVVDREVPLMVHEAIVNALKHGHPSRVSVDVRTGPDDLQVIVSDDGSGFPFTGRQEHAGLQASNQGPVSLRERVASLGGAMAVESSPAGARIELTVPLGAEHG